MNPYGTATADTIAAWLRESRHVLVGAGAGLSAAAGIDYGDEEEFGRLFPAMVRRGFRARYQLIGEWDLDPAVFWGYWAAHVRDIRFGDRPGAVYRNLLELLRGRDYFVHTSNVDAMFVRHGFLPERVCTIQGDYGFMQCRRPCRREVWSSQPIVERLAAVTAPSTQEITDASLIPKCPYCQGPVFLNVRAGRWFVEEPYVARLTAFKHWLAQATTGPLLALDIGSGFNTPSVVRWPMEAVALKHPGRLVRINRDHPEVPAELESRAVATAEGAAEVLEAVLNRARASPS